MNTAILHLIPNFLAEETLHVIPSYIQDIVKNISIFYVEEIKSARRFLKKIDKNINIDALTFHFLNEHEINDLHHAKQYFKDGKTIAYISEAGCAAVADPGAELVSLAHLFHVKVVPHVGPNSILLALMASGFNGQKFLFHGYLPNKQPALTHKIKEIEQHSLKENCTQIFIETPYRNNQVLSELIAHCHAHTKLCVASNLTSVNEKIISCTVAEWRKMDFNFHKIPSVFLLSVSN
ncbi:MAG: SAM-dependent methyltransferase [Chitinophagaceae bacterium]|nr:MAG: uroporphyrin-III C/tetrapyrrole methyltransferase [Bacteroidetes bacterium OLB11]MCC6447482.1 SAM-dependent methyltransferase [Chitinophagaceae bacterium]